MLPTSAGSGPVGLIGVIVPRRSDGVLGVHVTADATADNRDAAQPPLVTRRGHASHDRTVINLAGHLTLHTVGLLGLTGVPVTK